MIHPLFVVSIEIILTLGAIFYVFTLIKKSFLESTVQISCNSGDSEVMTFNINTSELESEEAKKKKIDSVFSIIQNRRDYNHKRWEEVKRQSIEENKAKLESVK